MFFVLLSVTQFHACYWAGRTVPNMLALSAGTWLSLRPSATSSESIRKRQEKKFTSAITLLAATASIIRAEVALLLFGILALVFYKESTSPSDAGTNPDGNKNTRMPAGKHRLTVLAVRTTIVAGITSTAISIAVDSYFWSAWLAGRRHQQQQRVSLDSNGQGPGALQSLLKMVGFATHWIWPEAWGLLFNVVEGKSSMWGTSPWYAYLFLHLPKLLLASLPLVVVPPLVNLRVRSAIKGWKALLLFPPAVLVLGMSMLGHKEWRFIIYVVPWFNTLAALIAAQIHHNYPGGMAMESLHRIHQARLDGVEADRRAANGTVRVFLPPSPRMTGASAYTFRHAPPFGKWEYNTTESLSTDFGTPEKLWRDGFDYVVTSMNEVEPFIAPSVKGKAEWVLLDSVNAFGGVERQKGLVPLGVRWKREIGILGRN
ncbi:hypothetical protein QFC21_007085 [Naganishia friedmannii]|uniref:Uncharacterized protein n=1 Tax=Naganishia friedmannii TaxID=89922 RepID=A0ACC2UYC3_9TREE|nr:hypothetical protein QFC21_007085 [Naganishia friedmannii]